MKIKIASVDIVTCRMAGLFSACSSMAVAPLESHLVNMDREVILVDLLTVCLDLEVHH